MSGQVVSMASAARGLDATPVVSAAFRQGRIVSVKITDLAPAGRPHNRWRAKDMFGPPIEGAVRDILGRIERGPGEVEPRLMKAGDVALLDVKPGELKRPLAFIWAGLTLAEIRAALTDLHRAGWRP